MRVDPLKILLVDDIPQNLVALEALLRRADVELVSVRSGSEALEQCLVNDFSLALIDVQMPEMDGFELAELMRGSERTKHVPIIFVTAGARDQARMFGGYERGAVDFLYKPIDPQVLSSKVNVFIELAKQRRELTQALQINEMFMGILGHDLRNPLAAVAAGIEVLAMRSLDDHTAKVLDRMRSSSKRMQDMITELLDLTRARLGSGMDLARSAKPTDLHELLRRAIDELRAAHHREINLECSQPCITVGDDERLLQLFSNLLANAIAHGTANTPITVRLSLRGSDCVIDVHNHGAIPRDMMATLFEPFRRSPTNRSRNGGLGLGLYIAQQIAHAHGGTVTAESSDASGTVFSVRLPHIAAAERSA